ncbi:chromate transporter [Tateyamaria omphalii]|uniref:chromate efflux transporter n=1 Tax=Tateyamaria omphalii TaxID=299262 RepID=UPI0016734C0B|nr:chromate efflux transporter [Tateyamaria omphalii]GGX45798.1 chromate transporter [Tateyamaria omphalii]
MEQSWSELTRVFGRIGLLSFGGPAAQIALMHETLVSRQKWLTEDQYLRALSLCMLLPGPEAMQLATYAGWRLRGIGGGLLAGSLFVVPGAVVILALALAYIHFGDIPMVQAAFLGIKAAVIVIVLQALLRLGRNTLQSPVAWGLSCAAFLALFVFGIPFPLVVVAAGIVGALHAKGGPTDALPAPAQPRSGRTIVIFGTLWITPLAVLWFTAQGFLLEIGLFFSKLAVVTFGGAYAVLAYMTQQVVQDHGWIKTSQMIDALGLAETTPGPLILVTEFVALLAGYAQGGLVLALAAGALTLWVTFVPCFLWIFVTGPYLDNIAARPRLSAALHGITAAVVGVILNLSIWFALHVFFADVGTATFGSLPIPDLSTFNPWAVALAAFAGLLLLRLSVNLPATLLVLAASGCALSILGLL